MPSFSDLTSFNQELVRKALSGAVFVKRYDAEDDEIEDLVGAEGLLEIPDGYEHVGLVTKDQGYTWTRDIETSDVTSHGFAEPTRRDITSDVSGLQFTAQETKAAVLGLYDGIDLSDVNRDANGNVSYDKPDRPASIYYRAFALFKDGDGADAVYGAKWLPRCQVTERGEQVWNEENEIQYALTFTGFTDAEVGTALRTMFAGPADLIDDMGFPAAT